MNKKTICFVAGKSGGHIIPCLTLAQQKYEKEKYNVLFFSANMHLDKKILSNNSLITRHIILPFSSFSFAKIFHYPLFFLQACISFGKSFFYLCKYMPKKIISTGGIVSLPVCFSAFILRVPIILYELNAVPGKAIKLLAPIAQNIFVCFKSTEKFFIQKKCKVINYPIKFLQKDKKIDKKTACKQLQLDPHKKTIAVLGGSQGSLFLNDCIKQWIHKTTLQAGQFQMIHQTGSNDSTDWQHFYQGQKITAHVFSFSYDIAKIYAAADVIICRAGAGTLFEILFFEKPCIVIPLKTHTTSHQIDNARTISQEYPHLFHLLLQDDIEKKPAILFSYLDQLINESATNKNKLSCINTLRLNLPFRSP